MRKILLFIAFITVTTLSSQSFSVLHIQVEKGREQALLKLFDDMIISGRENLVKPDPSIYLLAIKRFNLKANQTIFVDDKLENNSG